ncbi:MAG: STAS domain-containing protein [Alphaproteobacteria bacterium]|nr:STAS domain-containing protein [Alphaproteobacteria bacterium]
MTNDSLLEVQNQSQFSIIRFFGFVDADLVKQAKSVIDAKIPADCPNIIIDLEKVEFLDSHGIGLFASLLKKVHHNNGQLIFAGATAQPASVLDIVGFNGSLVTYCEDLQQACSLLEEEKKDH